MNMDLNYMNWLNAADSFYLGTTAFGSFGGTGIG